MPQFRYKARDRSGVPITGLVEADSPEAVSVTLRELGYQVVFVREQGGVSALFDNLVKNIQRYRPQEVVFFTRQLAMMVQAGLPLIEAMKSVSSQIDTLPFRKTLLLVIEDLKGGLSFSEALRKHPRYFSSLYVSMITAGEAAGILDQVLERLASVGEEEMELKGRIKSALMYPILLVLMSLAIVTFLLVGVLPKFIDIFEQAGAKLPVPTRILMNISWFLRTFWYLPLLGIGALIFFIRRYAKTPVGKYRLHSWILKVPIVGPLLSKTILARFSRITGSLLKSGVQIVTALAITKELVGNQVVKQSLEHIREAVIGGSNLAEPFRMNRFFPPTLVQLISVGERTGSMDDVLLHVSGFYEAEVDRDLRTLTSTLEPLLLLVMGLFIGFIALSVLLPIFSLVQVFKK